MAPAPGRVLIVEDEVNIRAGLRAVLTNAGHVVAEAASAEEALKVLPRFACEAALIDIRMAAMSGIELLKNVRGRWPHISVVVLTGHGTLESAMAAIKAGAHDYLLKPATPETIRQSLTAALTVSRRRAEQAALLRAMRAGLERLDTLPAPAPSMGPSARAPRFEVGDLCVDVAAHAAYRNGTPVPLTPAEFKLLAALAARVGQAVDYATLVRHSLGYEAEPWEARELIKRHVFALRHKIETHPARPRYVLNVRGVGYRLASPERPGA